MPLTAPRQTHKRPHSVSRRVTSYQVDLSLDSTRRKRSNECGGLRGFFGVQERSQSVTMALGNNEKSGLGGDEGPKKFKGSGANANTANRGYCAAQAHSAASVTPVRFKRTLVPAPSAANPSGISTVGSTGAVKSEPRPSAPPTSVTVSRPRLALRQKPGPAAQQPTPRPLEQRPPPAPPAPVVQPNVSWATIAARNAGPSGPTIRVLDQPAPAPPPPPTPTILARRQGGVAASPNTFANPLEEGALELTGFHPMEALYAGQTDGAASSVGSWALDRLARQRHGFSPNYQGNIHNPRNRPPLLDDKENCSIFITNLPLGMKEGWLLDELTEIGPFGKVHRTHVMEPTDKHPLPSARLCLWDRRAADNVYRAIDDGLLVINGMTARVRWDIIHNAPHLGRTFLSRSILLRGPAHIVDVESIYEILNEWAVYQTQKISVLWETEEQREIRWIFGSFYAQAEPIRVAFCRRWANNPNVYVRCGVEPLEFGWGAIEPSAYDVNPGPDNERKKLPQVDPEAEDQDED